MRLVYEGGVNLFGQLTDINNGWVRCVRAIHAVMTDVVSSPHSPPVLVSATERSCTTLTALALVDHHQKLLHIYACTVYNSCGYYSRVAFISLRASDCVAAIRGSIQEIHYQFLRINALLTFDVTHTRVVPWHTHQRWPSAVGSSSEQ